ncbi:hypothetical protein [Streptomyces lavendulae]|uniref:hypothetical protein n=1 Tax=Streptomyces lavendulae TaxID=1914 RepID=UPI0024A31846|nr:hypothetical protein [Streptomyces lavendulae]GLX22525.1 hypothetical protein Slala01_61690 [Streptomyces lavendulae subsp. lavendulae]GLX30008.1 hypothetical protein Slala02_58280 [Streptomyces lavendulae subsp. lavendulae]
MTLRSNYLWQIALSEQPPMGLPSDLAAVRVGLALGLPAIDALVGDGTDVGPVRYCLDHRQLVVPVEAETVHRWRAAHSVCVPAARSRSCGAGGYRGCTGVWVARPGSARAGVTPAGALHEALSTTRARLRTAPGTHNPRHEDARCA